MTGHPRKLLARQALVRIDVVIAIAVGVGICWLLGSTLLLIFAALLLAVALDAAARIVGRTLRVHRMLAFPLAAAATFGSMFAALYLLLPPILKEGGALWDQVFEAWLRVQAYLLQFDWISELFQSADQDIPLSDAAALAANQVTGAIASVLSIGSGLLIISVLGLFLAASPDLYRRGVLRLFPAPQTRRVSIVLRSVASGLRRWLLGQAFSMAFLGITVSAGLFVLGIDIWLSLGLLVAIFTLVPYLGPLAAAVPVLAVAYGTSWETGLAATVFYLVAQNLEGYVLTPMVQRQAVSIPPALLIGSQLVMGTIAGIPGILVAAPLAVATMIAVDELYVRGALRK
jgi:predicted PurR-regulated permease PerM